MALYHYKNNTINMQVFIVTRVKELQNSCRILVRKPIIKVQGQSKFANCDFALQLISVFEYIMIL